MDLAGTPAACRRIRTRDFFSAIDEQVAEKGEKAVYYVQYVSNSPSCYSISVPELFPNYSPVNDTPICIGMKQGRRSASLSTVVEQNILVVLRTIDYYKI